jgi:flagellar biosynthesis protein FlhA
MVMATSTLVLDQPTNRGNFLSGLGAPAIMLMMLAMIVLPLPATALDFLFTMSIALSIMVLMASVYATRPLDFGVFPTVLLLATLMRLALNVASTRVVLLNGHTGTDSAGRVIEAFGEFVVGGSYAVGLVLFTILVVINFVVVTKGATRVSEVTARFTLDAMPGKQMAIDADLNAGLISADEALERRERVTRESDFYGAMDGASKFVRGDAVAGILILFINILGGFAIGTLQHDLDASQAAQNYVLLTIGDGLVAQIPSMLLSTATAIIVTRISGEQDMSAEVSNQLTNNPKVLYVAAGIIGSMGIVPGMPNVVFLSIATLLAVGGYLRSQEGLTPELVDAKPEPVESLPKSTELSWDDVSSLDQIGLEVGYRLIPLVDAAQGGDLLSRIKGVRKKLSQELGFLVDSVHIRDNLDLGPNKYRISIHGVSMGEGEVIPDRELAINPGQVFGQVDGIATKDPTFGLDALWIDPSQRDAAQTQVIRSWIAPR